MAKLTTYLKGETQRASVLAMMADESLRGSKLSEQVQQAVAAGMAPPPDFWERLLSERNDLLIANSNKWRSQRAKLEQRQDELQARGAWGAG